MWYRNENGGYARPSDVDTTSSKVYVYVRRNIVFVEDVKDGDEIISPPPLPGPPRFSVLSRPRLALPGSCGKAAWPQARWPGSGVGWRVARRPQSHHLLLSSECGGLPTGSGEAGRAVLAASDFLSEKYTEQRAHSCAPAAQK